MTKRLFGGFALLLMAFGLSGCNAVEDKATSLSIIYGAAAVLSLLLLIGCCLLVRKKRVWFLLLFSSVLVVNIGYAFLSMSTCLEMALWANRVAYLGSVFLPLAMLMIILNVTNTRSKKWLPISLFVLAVMVFLLATSPGVLNIYDKEVSFALIDGVPTLVKAYGPLHSLYLFYPLGYFVAMVTVILRALSKEPIYVTSHAVILAIVVLVNLGVWFIEQLSRLDFEMLSISYIISELFLLDVHLLMNENQRLRELVRIKEKALQTTTVTEESQRAENISEEAREHFALGLESLTPTERAIYDAYLKGMSTKAIMSELNIKENTLKFHNKNLYSKLSVSSRKQLLEVYRAIKTEGNPNGDKE